MSSQIETNAEKHDTRRKGLVAASAYKSGEKPVQIDVENAGKIASEDGRTVWIGLHEPSPELLSLIQEQLQLPDLAIDDTRRTHHHPKIESYGNSVFLVVRTAQMKTGHVELGETHVFVGKGYVVSVRHGASKPYTEVRERCEKDPKSLASGPDYILYAILDFIVDNFSPVIDELRAQVEQLEHAMLFEKTRASHIRRLYQLRRQLLRVRKAVVPLLDVCARLQAADILPICKEMQPLFRNVTDHVRVLKEDIESMREVLSFAFEANLLTVQSEQTIISRRLAAWAAILAVPTAIAGIYGMNFDNMPELKWQYGYFYVLGLIGFVCCALFAMFKRSDWI